MLNCTNENNCGSRSYNYFLEAIIFDWMVQVIKYETSSWSFLREGTLIVSLRHTCIQEVISSVFAPPSYTGTSDNPSFDVIHLMKDWNFALLSDDDQNLSISTGNCFLMVEMLVYIGSNLLLRFLSPCLILCWRYRSKAMAMRVRPFYKALSENPWKCSP